MGIGGGGTFSRLFRIFYPIYVNRYFLFFSDGGNLGPLVLYIYTLFLVFIEELPFQLEF